MKFLKANIFLICIRRSVENLGNPKYFFCAYFYKKKIGIFTFISNKSEEIYCNIIAGLIPLSPDGNISILNDTR